MRIATFLSTCLFTAASFNVSATDNLMDIYQAAQMNDPVIRAAEAKLRSQSESKTELKSNLLPQILFSHAYSELDIEQESDNAGADEQANYEQKGTLTTISISQTLINLSQWYAYKGGSLFSEQAEAEYAKDEQELLSRTLEAYLNVLRAHDNLASSYAEETAIKQQLDQTRQRFDVGLVAITEVHESQAAYDLAKVSRLANEGALQTAYEGLTVLTGDQHDAVATLSQDLPITQPEPATKQEWADMALQYNLELRQARKAVNAAKYTAKATKAGHYPTLKAGISRQTQVGHREFEDSPSFNVDVDDNTQTTVSLTLEVPLYTGGKVSSARRKAYADYDQAKETLIGAERGVTQQTRALHIAVTTQIQQVAARKQSITSTQSALEAIEAGYNVGTRNIVDVLNAQRSVYNAQRDYANARYDYIEQMFDLKKAGGVLTPADIEALNQWLQNDKPATQQSARKAIN